MLQFTPKKKKKKPLNIVGSHTSHSDYKNDYANDHNKVSDHKT